MEIILPFVTSLIITAIFVPVTIKLAQGLNLVDDPVKNPQPNKIHTSIIPRAGGLPIYIGIFITTLIFLPLEKHIIGTILGITALLVMGLIDDRIKNFNPYLRLLFLFLAACLAVIGGIGISYVTNPLQSFSFLPEVYRSDVIRLDTIIIPFEFIGKHSIVLIADILALIWIVSLTQIINWSKGVDGQMPGITLIASLVLAGLSFKLYLEGDPNQLNIAYLSLITAGASLGFLLFNWHPAKILPGFSASTILAFMLAILSILSGAKLATALLVLAIPTTDFLYTLLRRILSGKSPVWGDRGHLHHKLLERGWSHQKIALFYIFGSAILGSAALLLPSGSKAFVLLAAVVVAFGFILWLNSFGVLSKRPDPGNG